MDDDERLRRWSSFQSSYVLPLYCEGIVKKGCDVVAASGSELKREGKRVFLEN